MEKELNKKNVTYLQKTIDKLETQIKNTSRDYINSNEENVVEITRLKDELKQVNDEKNQLEEKIKELENKSDIAGDEKFKKFTRITSLITEALKNPASKLPLKTRLKLLFKMKGLTIGAIIAAIVMFFTSLGLGISLSLRGIPTPTPTPGPTPDPKPSIPDRIKEGLKKFAEWLKELAKKSAAALPGIIGSIVSFIIKTAGAAVGFLSEHMIILIFVIVSSVIYGLVEGVKKIKNKNKN